MTCLCYFFRIHLIVDVVKNSVFSGSIGHMIFINMNTDYFKAEHNMIITRYDLLFPDVLAFKVHKTFRNHRSINP